MSDTTNKPDTAVEREAMFGVLPVMAKEKLYGFLDAFLVLSGYCIATWSYTQGSYLATLVGFRQLLTGAFLGAILMLVIYQMPVILSVRFGIDIWVWLRAAFGPVGILIMTVTIYYESSYPTEFVKDMVNTRIFEALKENNIEIPYNHMTVELSKEETQISSAGAAATEDTTAPVDVAAPAEAES